MFVYSEYISLIIFEWTCVIFISVLLLCRHDAIQYAHQSRGDTRSWIWSGWHIRQPFFLTHSVGQLLYFSTTFGDLKVKTRQTHDHCWTLNTTSKIELANKKGQAIHLHQPSTPLILLKP